jgi:hypothetical protein
MPANTPNLSSINTVGEQFKHNAFATLHTKVMKQGVKNNIATKKAAATRTANRKAWANSVNSTLKTAQAAHAQHTKAQAAAAMKAQKAHASAVNKGTAAPAQGAAPRTFAVPTSPAQKQAAAAQKQAATAASKTAAQAQRAHASQVNNAHGQALAHVASQQKVMQQQRNNAHGQAIVQANQMARAAAKVNTPPKAPGKPKAPAKQPAGQFSQAVHPGSSTQTLPSATASVSTPTAPQHIAVGSWTAKPGGIAAAGSHLEAWAQTKGRAVQARRKSEAAGGRDRSLATSAREWESAANQPLGNTNKEE